MDALADVLGELRRVVRPDGSLYVAVPDASTITDRLYRWLYHGGGHVNSFRSAEELGRAIVDATGLRLTAIRILYTSLAFLNADQFHPLPPRRLWLLGHGNPRVISALNYALRTVDRIFRTRLSIYGWALYFGNVPEQIETTAWTNVCSRCGSGHSAASLIINNRVRRAWLGMKSYTCPDCGAMNLFTRDRPLRSA